MRQERRKRNSCCGYLQRFDNFCMKPIFIRKYTPEKERQQEAFVNDFIEKGSMTEKQFMKEK